MGGARGAFVLARTRGRRHGLAGNVQHAIGMMLSLCLFFLAPLLTYAQDAVPPTANGSDGPAAVEPYVLLRADEVTYDENEGIATARGSVEIAHGERVLRADEVIYSESQDLVTANGNVAILEPNGDVMFADHAEFTQGLKDGVVHGFRMLFTDNSRLAAAGGQRTGGVVTTLNKAVFSPCDLCKDDPERAPLWRVRAVRVIHDGARKDIIYKDAVLEIFGIPVAYTPYFSHPDPKVKRRSGLLAPSYASDSVFGLVVKLPFFLELAPNEDVTVTPIINTDEAWVLAAEYRRHFTNGYLDVEGSITNPDRREGDVKIGGSETRGHLTARGRFDIDRIWRTKFQLEHASDDTYLRLYDFPVPSNQTLTTSFNTEGFKGPSYAQLSGYRFQGLRETDDPGESPLVLPFAELNYVSRPTASGSFITADTSFRSIYRDQGADSRRMSLKTGWHLPFTGWTGELYSVSATLQSDLYSVDDVLTGGGETKDGIVGRVFPQLMFQWRYPFIRPEKTATHLLEPIAAVVIAPNGGNPDKIPNEDSQDIEFDDTNLFSPTRFTGIDRVESGQRFIYGVNWGLYGNDGGAIEAFLGQSYRLQSKSIFPPESGLRDQASDVVGRLRIAPSEYLDFLYRFRIDPDGPKANRTDIQLTGGPPGFRINANYFFISEDAGTGEFGDREELRLGLNYRISRRWRGSAFITEDLTKDGGTIAEGIGFQYQDECLIFKASFTRNFTEDRDLQPSDTLFFQVIFKHLGEFGTGS